MSRRCIWSISSPSFLFFFSTHNPAASPPSSSRLMMAPLSWLRRRLLPAVTILPVWCHRVFAPLPRIIPPALSQASNSFCFNRLWFYFARFLYLVDPADRCRIAVFIWPCVTCFVTRIKQNVAQTPLSPQINNSLPSLFSPPLHSPSIWTKVSDGRCICFTNSNILVMKKNFFTPGGTWENALLWWPQPWTYQINKPAHYRVWGKKHFFLWALSSVWCWHSEWTQRRNHALNRSLQ